MELTILAVVFLVGSVTCALTAGLGTRESGGALLVLLIPAIMLGALALNFIGSEVQERWGGYIECVATDGTHLDNLTIDDCAVYYKAPTPKD